MLPPALTSLPSLQTFKRALNIRNYFADRTIWPKEACLLTKSNLQALDFVINRFFMKLFKTSSIDTVKHCKEYFGFDLPSVLWAKRMQKFEVKFCLYLSSA